MPRGKRKLAVAAGKQKQSKSTSSAAKVKASLSAAKRRRTSSDHVSASEGVHATSREVAIEHTPDPTSSENVYPSTSTERGRTRLTSSTDTAAHGGVFSPMSTHPHEFATSAEAGGTLPSANRSSAAYLRALSPSAEAGGTLPPAARLSSARL